nr:MAG TPA: apolipoprotein [Bacteriophage sp.]
MAPSLLGSSMSSPEKTLMSMGAGLTALTGSILAPETGGASIALTAGAVSFLSGMAAGADENFANVADATNEIAKKDLAKKGQMDKFLADARKVLGYNTTEEDAL